MTTHPRQSPALQADPGRQPFRILKVGAEGGSFAVHAREGDQGSLEFQVIVSESVLDEAEVASGWLPDWEAVLVHIGRWPWPNLFPLAVHPDWRGRVMQAVLIFRDREGASVRPSALTRWQSLCADQGGQ
ncbi:MAG: hypothetical protein HXX10_26070 [Rhodoplanes sp.]|uniref:hypothetical protein n=1 Tax=Rhodoplanes sp. TaxID=1968906 RepID=UPI0017FFA86C|nr:hypothetical protein [Rhodoplanes sp.]NVO17509.1 hypothetical protein [Rhodoplanes sp.]